LENEKMKRNWIFFTVILIGLILFLGVKWEWHNFGQNRNPSTSLCPVCQRIVIVNETTPKWEYKGRIFYFSNLGHQKIFMDNPQKFLK
jgi:YHS domain-containing protein